MNDKKHLLFMQKALRQAELALKKKEVPVGALVVDSQGNILGRGYNKIEKTGCQASHAEVIAIKKACKKRGDWRLDDCWIYVTLEPCLMCFGLIQLSRIKRVVFGATSELFGAGLGDIVSGNIDSYKKFYKNNLIIKGGLKEKESVDILKEFFKTIRKKRKVRGEAKIKVLRKGSGEVVKTQK